MPSRSLPFDSSSIISAPIRVPMTLPSPPCRLPPWAAAWAAASRALLFERREAHDFLLRGAPRQFTTNAALPHHQDAVVFGFGGPVIGTRGARTRRSLKRNRRPARLCASIQR